MKSRRLVLFLAAALAMIILASSCSKKKNPTSPAGSGTIATVASVVVMGTPAYSPNFSTTGSFTMAIIAQTSNGTMIPLNANQIIFAVDSTKGYSIVVDQATTQQPATGPLGVGMNFDGSGSMSSSDPSRLRVSAGKDFLRRLQVSKPSSKASVAEFGVAGGDDYYFHLWCDFTSVGDTVSLFPAIDSLSESGATPLYTSLRRTLEHTDSTLSASQYARCLLSFTDGGDNDSYTQDSLGAVIALANAKSIPVFVVGLGDAVETENLQRLASATGGVYAWADSASALIALFNAMGLGLAQGYNLVQAHFTTIPPAGTNLTGRVQVTSGGATASSPILFAIPTVTTKKSALRD